MAIRGTIAKQQIINKLEEYFGTDFIGISNNKVYLAAEENGEEVQIALSLACPKVLLPRTTPSQRVSSNAENTVIGSNSTNTTTLTKEEQDRIAGMLKKLDLIAPEEESFEFG